MQANANPQPASAMSDSPTYRRNRHRLSGLADRIRMLARFQHGLEVVVSAPGHYEVSPLSDEESEAHLESVADEIEAILDRIQTLESPR